MSGVNKSPLALRTISEAADKLGLEQHVLRFWETKFPFIRPTKRAGGRRFYRPQDIELLTGVKTLLRDRGYTIRGVQKLFKDEGQRAILNAPAGSHANDRQSGERHALDDLPTESGVVPGQLLWPAFSNTISFFGSGRCAKRFMLSGGGIISSWSARARKIGCAKCSRLAIES